MSGSGAVVTVGYGPPALGALAGAIRSVQAADLLAPVTVAVPSSHVGVSVRRHLARLPHPDGRAGMVNVAWLSLPQIAELLAGPSLVAEARPPLTDVISRAAIRSALDSAPGRFRSVVDNATTEHRLGLTFADLRELDTDDLDRLEALSGSARDLVRLFQLYRTRCEPFADQRDSFDRATALATVATRSGSSSSALSALGPLIVYLPTRLSRPERRLLAAMAGVDRLTVVIGLTGDAVADRPARSLVAQVAADLGTAPVTAGASVTSDEPTPVPTFVRAPDLDEEVRIAVRTVLEGLATGLRPDDIAIVSRVGDPYTLLVHEHLQVAGIAHHARSPVVLRQSVAGRALVGFLSVAERGFRRAELFRWVRSAPIRMPGGRPVPPAYDQLARRAGVAQGLDQWHRRLDRLTDEYQRRAAADGGRDHQRELADIAGLHRFVDRLAELATPPSTTTWAAYASWADALVAELLGEAAAMSAWPDPERESFDRVRGVIASLASLDPIETLTGLDRFTRVLTHELEAPALPSGAFGHGVFVGRLADLSGARHELVVVLGMAEGLFPPRGQDDALLPDRQRRTFGDHIAERRPSRAEERRSFMAALAAAPRTHLSFARTDRSQREAVPSRFFLAELGRARGEPVLSDDLDRLAIEPGSLLVDVASFQAGALGAAPACSAQEMAVGALLAGATPEASIHSGIDAVTARSSGAFTRWTGLAGAEFAPRFVGDRVGSSTSFEQWASCPFRYFLGHVLDVRPLDSHADADAISGLDRGSFVHEVLEAFMSEQIGRPAPSPWDEADLRRMHDLAIDVASRYEEQGRTGRPLLWQLELESLLGRLDTILAVDSQHRSTGGTEPLAVEFAFAAAEGDAAPVDFTLPSGRIVSFRGAIDRIDRDPATGRLVVLDYKTGKSSGYGELDDNPVDITCRGRHLQLVIYGEAARRHFGSDLVESYYWFVEQQHATLRLGDTMSQHHVERFLEVLEVIVDGIEQGRFPANPGVANYWGFSNCGFCDYDRVCPSGRDDMWEGVRLSGELATYVALAEPDRLVPGEP